MRRSQCWTLLFALCAPAVLLAMPPELHVSGNRMVDANGSWVRLYGASVAKMEYGDYYGDVAPAVSNLVGSGWRANCVRILVNQNYWLGNGGNASNYRSKIDALIQIVTDANGYVDLALYPVSTENSTWMPNQQATNFWADVASRYKGNPGVLFDLFNEPQAPDWNTWRNGGTISDGSNPSYYTDGMQNILQTIRNQGARNIIIAGGLSKCSDLTGLANGYALSDPNGDGVVYAAHLYPWVYQYTDKNAPDEQFWNERIANPAQNYPVIVEETGADNGEAYSPNPGYWCQKALVYFTKHGFSWIGWAFANATPAFFNSDGSVSAEGQVFQQEMQDESQANAPIGRTIALQANNGLFVSTDLNMSSDVRAGWATSAQGWEQYQVRNTGGGFVSLLANANGQYVSTNAADSRDLLQANQGHALQWEQYVWRKNPDGTVSLRSAATGCFVTANLGDSNVLLEADHSVWPQAWEEFSQH